MSEQDQWDYDRGIADVRRGLTAKQGGVQAEQRTADAAERLMAAGELPPLKKKYQVGRRMKIVRH